MPSYGSSAWLTANVSRETGAALMLAGFEENDLTPDVLWTVCNCSPARSLSFMRELGHAPPINLDGRRRTLLAETCAAADIDAEGFYALVAILAAGRKMMPVGERSTFFDRMFREFAERDKRQPLAGWILSRSEDAERSYLSEAPEKAAV